MEYASGGAGCRCALVNSEDEGIQYDSSLSNFKFAEHSNGFSGNSLFNISLHVNDPIFLSFIMFQLVLLVSNSIQEQ